MGRRDYSRVARRGGVTTQGVLPSADLGGVTRRCWCDIRMPQKKRRKIVGFVDDEPRRGPGMAVFNTRNAWWTHGVRIW